MNWLRRAAAFLLSFRKRDWSARDYPIRYRRQRGEGLKPWVAQIPGWWLMNGLGDTREEAFRDLEKSIENYRAAHGVLPRPGKSVAVKFAPMGVLAAHEDLARELFPPILGYDFDECLVTDESSVWDFPVEYSEEELVRKVLLVFGVDISDLAERGILAEILQRIAAHRRR